MNINEIANEVGRFFFKREKLELDIDKPFQIQITPLSFGLEIMEWIFFSAFWIISIGVGLGAPIALAIKGESPIFMVPVFALFWFGLTWLFFYGWGWFCIGSNFPKRVIVDENGVSIHYPIQFLNKKIPKERLTISRFSLFGTPILKIKEKKRLKGIWINEYMYRIVKESQSDAK